MSTLTALELSSIVDEMAELHRKIKPIQSRFEKIKKQLLEYANNQEGNDSIILTSDNNYITYSKPSYSLVCNNPKLFLESTSCFEAVTISVTKAKDFCTPEVLVELFENKKGSRKIMDIVPIVSS